MTQMNLWASLSFRQCAMAIAAISLSAATLWSTAAAQGTASDTAQWQVPRTPHGHPDLQGNWTNATLTPIQRPKGLGPVLSPEQVVEIEEGQAPTDRPEVLTDDGYWRRFGEEVGLAKGSATSEAGDRVAIVDGEPRSSLVMNPADGRVPALTPEGLRRVEGRAALRSQFDFRDHPELLPLEDRCLVSFGSNAGPPMLPNYFYLNNYTIVQTPDHLMIMTEMVHDARIIRLSSPTPLPSHIRPWFGDSWGRWEGDTLVVETTNLNPDHPLRGVPPSEDRKVIERFTRVSEDSILYEFTIDDLTMYESVWGGQVPFDRFNDLLYEYACHEGNYSLANTLSGARYEESREENR